MKNIGIQWLTKLAGGFFPATTFVIKTVTAYYNKRNTPLKDDDFTPKDWFSKSVFITLRHCHHLFQKGKVEDGTFVRGLRPDFWCMPILKTDEHREALLKHVFSSEHFGAGTDSAPHDPSKKYCDCSGCFTAPFAAQMYAMTAEEAGKLAQLPAFLGTNMLEEVYGIRVPKDAKQITLVKKPTAVQKKYCRTFLTPDYETKEYGNGHACVNSLPVDLTWSIET